jgi:GH24 family phage-related lysozyme (muramidase)
MIDVSVEIVKDCCEFIKKQEDLSLKSYFCSAGVEIIGYGHAVKKGEKKEITVDDANLLLVQDVQLALESLKKLTNIKKLNKNQIVAMTSFIFNFGEAKTRTSTLIKLLNGGVPFEIVAQEFHRWVYTNGEINKSLIARRKRESNLFLEPVIKTKQKLQDKSALLNLIFAWFNSILNILLNKQRKKT